jgi:hypothetical protein
MVIFASFAVCRVISPANNTTRRLRGAQTTLAGQASLRTVDDRIDFIVDATRDLQYLRSCHPSLLLSKFIQSLQRIFNIAPAQQFLQIFFYMNFS